MSNRLDLRAISLAVHKYAGLTAGLVILVVAFTGAMLVYAEPINRALHPELWEVESGAVRLPPDSILSLARASRGQPATSIIMAREPTDPVIVGFRGGIAVHVDPYSGEILGELDTRRSLIGVSEGLHTSLLMGRPGLWIVVLSTLVLFGLVLTGYVLWWPRSKTESKRAFTVEWRAGWKRFVYDGHNVFGFYASGYLLLITLTGLLLSFPIFSRVVYRVTGAERPPQPPRSAVVGEDAVPVALSEAVRVAVAASDGGDILSISVPARPRQAVRVAIRPEGARADVSVFVDQYSGAVIRVDRQDERSAVAKALALAFPIHSGKVLGWPTELLAFLASVVAGVLPITGFLIWFPRWRAKRRRRFRAASIRDTATLAASVGGREERRK